MAETPANVAAIPHFRGATVLCDYPADPADWSRTEAELYNGATRVAVGSDNGARNVRIKFRDLLPGIAYTPKMRFRDGSGTAGDWATGDPFTLDTAKRSDVALGAITDRVIEQVAVDFGGGSGAVWTESLYPTAVWITDFEIEFELGEEAAVDIWYNIAVRQRSRAPQDAAPSVGTYTLAHKYNDGSFEQIDTSIQFIGAMGQSVPIDDMTGGEALIVWGTVAYREVHVLPAGDHVFRVYFTNQILAENNYQNTVARTMAMGRILGAELIYR